jgi:hypothetical protein
MKFLILVIGLLLCAGQAQAAAAPARPSPMPPDVERIEVFELGLYERGEIIAELPPSPAGIGRAASVGEKHLRTTRQVPAQLGTSFGFRFRVIGRTGAQVPLTEVFIFPPEGLQSTYSGQLVTRDVMSGMITVGDESLMRMTFDHRWEMVPGIWTIELWSGDKKLGEESFEVFIPPTS